MADGATRYTDVFRDEEPLGLLKAVDEWSSAATHRFHQ
jgi:hypothetical protein